MWCCGIKMHDWTEAIIACSIGLLEHEQGDIGIGTERSGSCAFTRKVNISNFVVA